jgi:hypothetical protein
LHIIVKNTNALADKYNSVIFRNKGGIFMNKFLMSRERLAAYGFRYDMKERSGANCEPLKGIPA